MRDLCGKCVRACNEVQVNEAIEFDNASPPAKVVAGDDNALKDSECVFCGECIQVVPLLPSSARKIEWLKSLLVSR